MFLLSDILLSLCFVCVFMWISGPLGEIFFISPERWCFLKNYLLEVSFLEMCIWDLLERRKLTPEFHGHIQGAARVG